MKISLALGFFDSVHIGHRKLLAKNKEYASIHGLTPAVYTFNNDMGEYFGSRQLYSFKQREVLLRDAGAELIISEEFNEKLRSTSGKDFLDELIAKYEVHSIFCGFDYTFGKDAECNVDFLKDYAFLKKINCIVCPPQLADGQKVSTTLIKQLLIEGNIERANLLLGEPYFMIGRVVHGRGVGSSFNCPTANIEYGGLLPKNGVYKTLVVVDGKSYFAVTNIGEKPTFDIMSVTIESMLIGFDGDLYGKELIVKFLKYLRPICKFKDSIELSKQIQKDIEEALC